MPRIDHWIPTPDVSASHAVMVDATPEHLYASLLAIDLGRHPLVATIMTVRALPALLVDPRGTLHRLRHRQEAADARPITRMLGGAFVLLEEDPPREIVLGLTGRFWTPTGGLVRSDAATFRDAIPSGQARAAWNFVVSPITHRRTRLTTETRVACADPETLQSFRRYWRLISPGSGLIRHVILRSVRLRAEQTSR